MEKRSNQIRYTEEEERIRRDILRGLWKFGGACKCTLTDMVSHNGEEFDERFHKVEVVLDKMIAEGKVRPEPNPPEPLLGGRLDLTIFELAT